MLFYNYDRCIPDAIQFRSKNMKKNILFENDTKRWTGKYENKIMENKKFKKDDI